MNITFEQNAVKAQIRKDLTLAMKIESGNTIDAVELNIILDKFGEIEKALTGANRP